MGEPHSDADFAAAINAAPARAPSRAVRAAEFQVLRQPEDAVAWIRLAILRATDGDQDGARRAASRAREIHPAADLLLQRATPAERATWLSITQPRLALGEVLDSSGSTGCAVVIGPGFRERVRRPGVSTTSEPREAADDALADRRFGEALELYRRVLSSTPNDAAALLGIARAQFGLEDWEDALNSYSKVGAVDPHCEEAWIRQVQLDTCERDRRDAAWAAVGRGVVHPVVDACAARRATEDGRPRTAFALASRAIRADIVLSEAYVALAELLRERHAVLRIRGRALVLGCKDLENQFQVALLLADAGEIEIARTLFRQILEADRCFIEYKLEAGAMLCAYSPILHRLGGLALALACEDLGKNEFAQVVLEDVVNAKVPDARAWYELARLCHVNRTEPVNVPVSIPALLRRALELDPSLECARELLAGIGDG